MATRSIKLVQFGALTARNWKDFAVEINTPSNRGSTETIGTPHDERLGALANGAICVSCGEKNNRCPGHWGYIDLEEPCYNPEYIETVVGILKCVCHKCVAPRVSESVAGPILHQHRSLRFKAYRKKAETIKQCSACSEVLPNYFSDKYAIKMFFGDRTESIVITAREAVSILMRISAKTMSLLGFNEDLSQNIHYIENPRGLSQGANHVHEVRPEAFIFEVLPVLPMCARPWIIKGGERKDDDLTDKYNSILKINARLRADRESPINSQPVRGRKRSGKMTDLDRKKTIDDLNLNIWTLIDNSKEKNKNNNNRQHKGLKERLGTKEGHIQSNVAGKRCDHAARTVIVGGGNMVRMEEIGVPGYIAKTITVPELVVSWNLNALDMLLKEGKINTICRGGFTIDVAEVTQRGQRPFVWKERTGLQLYDIVHRQLRTGDWGLFNRQPTLRLESMQGVRCVIFEDELVFRVPLGVTRTYNADFDGDEMNLHSPQSQGARVECSTICRTWFHMVSAQNNAPVMGCVQNTLLCFYYCTETFLTPEEVFPQPANYQFADGTPGYQTMIELSDFVDACVTADIDFTRITDLIERAAQYYPEYVYTDETGNLRFAKRIPGKIVASIVFPRTITWSRHTEVNDRLPWVKIKDGIILPDSGPLCKKVIGGTSNSIIHPLWKGLNGVLPMDGPKQAADLVTELQFMSSVLMPRIGFSMGISDCIPTESARLVVERAVEEAKIKCKIVTASDKNPEDKELEINGILNEAMSVAPKLTRQGMNRADRNALIIMKKSGAKGSDANNSQIAGFVGQQNLNGQRIPFGLSGDTRTLPHFLPNDHSPESKGFVSSSYMVGLNYKEQWFHATGGRRGVIDTALKSVTWETEIMIEVDGAVKIVRIGEWIDGLIDSYPDKTTRYEERNMEHLALQGEASIPSTDFDGVVTWSKLTAVTRHDPGKHLYKVTTMSGRSVIVTESKSLLVWNETVGKFVITNGDKVKKGDYLPSTNILEPDREITYIDWSDYIPKTEAIYGTDFCLCVKMLTDFMETPLPNGEPRKRTPGWWAQHNGREFTLPYKHAHSILRTIKRSDTAAKIVKGYIYPYTSNHSAGQLPDRFELNEDNGFFIGIYLAEGHSSIKAGGVSITNNDIEIQNRIKGWFDRFGIKYKAATNANKWGSSTTITGFSVPLATFLTKLLGTHSWNKSVPDLFYIAHKGFVKGVLDGYISGDGYVDKRGDIIASSASEKLIWDISRLCSRFGIFTSISRSQLKSNNLGTKDIRPSHTLSIRSVNSYLFAQRIGNTRITNLNKMRKTPIRLNGSKPIFRVHNDVVLDKIVDIHEIDVALHPHVYDLTVPSTGNFCLANGLHVVDTSDSGYIQKKIVNAISDIKVHHDGTTRNANGSIIQFAYGGDGMNAKELMNTKGLSYPFFMNFSVVADCFNSEAELGTGDLRSLGKPRLLTKEETNLLVTHAIQAGTQGFKTEVTEMITYNMKCATRAAVAEIKLYESMIPKFCRKVKDEFEHAKAKNGYMAGLVASCSIGEPTTQLTLNSVEWSSMVLIKIDGSDPTELSDCGVYIGSIGRFIDEAIGRADVITRFAENNTEYVDISEYKAQVVCVDEHGVMHWKDLEAVTRHLPGGDLIEVVTRMGRTVQVTQSKSMLVRENNRIVEKAGSAMQVGDYVPLVITSPRSEELQTLSVTTETVTASIPLDRDTGYTFGYYALYKEIPTGIMDGPVSWIKRTFGRSEATIVPAWVERFGPDNAIALMEHSFAPRAGSKLGIPAWSMVCDTEFVRGFLDAIFSHRSYLIPETGTSRSPASIKCSPGLGSEFTTGIAELCSRLSIFAKIEATPADVLAEGLTPPDGSTGDESIVLFAGFAKKFVREIVLTNKALGRIYESAMDRMQPPGMSYGGDDDLIPGIVTSDPNYQGRIHRDYISRHLAHDPVDPKDREVLERARDSEVFFDEVVSVTRIPTAPTDRVYDFTVADTRNFTIFGGLCVRDTFHNAGNSAKDVTLGVPRFQEILNASGRPGPSGKQLKAGCTIYLKPDVHTPTGPAGPSTVPPADILHLMSTISSPIACLYVEDVMTDYDLLYLPTEAGKPRRSSPLGLITYEEYEPKWWVSFRAEMGISPSFEADAWVVLIKLDKYKLYEHKLTVEDVATHIEESSFGSKGYAFACVPSPNTVGQIEVYINFTEVGEHEKNQVDMPIGEKITRYLVTPENIEYYAIREVAINLIKKTKIQGVSGISKTYIRQTPEEEWLIDTKGTNLMTILGLPAVDTTRTISDNMWEIYHVLGIEATRKFLIKEIIKILSFDGTYINSRHICLLVDGMLRQGTINSVNRDGIPRDVGPVAKGIFEMSVDNFSEAAAFAEHDKMKGVAASVMFGTLAEAGTGLVEIKDAERLPVPIRRPAAPTREPLVIPHRPKKR